MLFYGFDDLTPLQLDAVETLARHAPVTLALTFEPGRVAFAARAQAHNDLLPLADEVTELEGRPDHYAHPALHHLERNLFEADGSGSGRTRRRRSQLLEAGGERAEFEQVAAQVARLIRHEGYAPEDIAIVWRDVQDRGGADRAGPRRLRDPVRDDAPRAARPHRARTRPDRAGALRAARTRPPTTC